MPPFLVIVYLLSNDRSLLEVLAYCKRCGVLESGGVFVFASLDATRARDLTFIPHPFDIPQTDTSRARK